MSIFALVFFLNKETEKVLYLQTLKTNQELIVTNFDCHHLMVISLLISLQQGFPNHSTKIKVSLEDNFLVE